MTTSTTIPAATLTAGSYTYGPTTADLSDSMISATLDRTPTGGLNDDVAGATTVAVQLAVSEDGGTTWVPLGASEFGGGVDLDKFGNPFLMSGVASGLPDTGVARQIQATLVVTGPDVAVVGSLDSLTPEVS